MAITLDGTAGITAPTYNGSVPAEYHVPVTAFKNRIINGAMMIDQRNAGASVTPASGQYTLDRWFSTLSQASKYTIQQNAGSVTLPAGFINYLGVTSSSAYSITATDFFGINQRIEGFNIADLAWGTANAKTVTMSFYVYSSLTGTFGGSITNELGTRSYPFSYTINSANTWEQKSITITGETTGAWTTTNGVGMSLRFGLGVGSTYSGTAGSWAAANYLSATGATSVVGTNGATFYITGVQLEVGSNATSFDRRPYGTELALCQRYYQKITALAGNDSTFAIGMCEDTATSTGVIHFPVQMRTNPTALEQSGSASDYKIRDATTNRTLSGVPTFSIATANSIQVTFSSSSLTAGRAVGLRAATTSAYLGWSTEL